MTYTLRAFLLGLVVATFAVVGTVLVSTVALDALRVASADVHLGPIDFFSFERSPTGFASSAGSGVPLTIVAFAGLNAAVASLIHHRAPDR